MTSTSIKKGIGLPSENLVEVSGLLLPVGYFLMLLIYIFLGCVGITIGYGIITGDFLTIGNIAENFGKWLTSLF